MYGYKMNLMATSVKRTDTITKMIEEYNAKCIRELIADWYKDIGDDIYGNDEEQIVQGLYTEFQSDWNDEENDDDAIGRAETFLLDNCSLEIVEAIEDWYIYVEWEMGTYLHKRTLVDKLDMCYYFQAEEKCRKTLEYDELDLDYWG